jgi:type IV pilus assembly protein PilB
MEPLGKILLRKKIITEEQLEKALKEQKTSGGRIGSILKTLGFIDEESLVEFLSKQFGIPSVNLSDYKIDQEVLKLIPHDIIYKHQIIPLEVEDSVLKIATVNPSNIYAFDDIKFLTGYNVEVMVATESAFTAFVEKYYEATDFITMEDVMSGFDVEDVNYVEKEEELNIADLKKSSEDAPIIRLVNLILTDAMKQKASDIHIEPYVNSFRVRYRIDGILFDVMSIPLKLKSILVSRIKIMSRLDIAERRHPQDGRIKLKIGKTQEMEYRVSVLPTLFGEKVCLRLLDKSSLRIDMTKLGFEKKQLEDFREAIYKPFGIVLVTGPTGSGKTTTLYSALVELNKESQHILAVEDPVEFNLTGINQVNVNESIGLTFAKILRSFLRQDPDIIMLGEIRDEETAKIAINSALTGHLVLTTLHTNDAFSAIDRLVQINIEPFLVSSSLNLVLAQRLARKICNDCKEEIKYPKQVLINVGIPKNKIGTIKFHKGKGCKNCLNTGYKGRVALYEVMPVREELKKMIIEGASAIDLKKKSISLGIKTLRDSGIVKVMDGVTTIEEVLRVSIE